MLVAGDVDRGGGWLQIGIGDGGGVVQCEGLGGEAVRRP